MKVDPRTWDKAIEDVRAKRAGVAATARRLGVSENSVRKQLARARAGKRPPPPPPDPPAAPQPVPAQGGAPGAGGEAGPPQTKPPPGTAAADGGLAGFKAATGQAGGAPGPETPAQAADAAAAARRLRNEQTAAYAVGILQLATGLVCRGYAWVYGVVLTPEDMAKLTAITPVEKKILEDAAVPAMPYLEQYLEGSEEGALGVFLGHWASMVSDRVQVLVKVGEGVDRAGS